MENITRVYIDVQSLLELRQSVLIEMMGEEEAMKYVNSEEYYTRDKDEFAVDMSVFNALMKDYRVAFKNATVTYLEVVLRTKLANMEKLNAFNNEPSSTEIILNTYPYNLPQELVTGLRDGLFIKLGLPVYITVINEPLELFTPLYLKQHRYAEFFSYSASEWFSKHLESLGKLNLRETRLNFAAMGREALSAEDKKKLKKIGFQDVYQYTEFIFASAVKLNFLPVGFYGNVVTATVLLEKLVQDDKAKPLEEMEQEDVDLSESS